MNKMKSIVTNHERILSLMRKEDLTVQQKKKQRRKMNIRGRRSVRRRLKI